MCCASETVVSGLCMCSYLSVMGVERKKELSPTAQGGVWSEKKISLIFLEDSLAINNWQKI